MKEFSGVINSISYDGRRFALSVGGIMHEYLLFCKPEDIDFSPIISETGTAAMPTLHVGARIRFSGGMPDGNIHPATRDIVNVKFAQKCLPNGSLVNE